MSEDRPPAVQSWWRYPTPTHRPAASWRESGLYAKKNPASKLKQLAAGQGEGRESIINQSVQEERLTWYRRSWRALVPSLACLACTNRCSTAAVEGVRGRGTSWEGSLSTQGLGGVQNRPWGAAHIHTHTPASNNWGGVHSDHGRGRRGNAPRDLLPVIHQLLLEGEGDGQLHLGVVAAHTHTHTGMQGEGGCG